MAYVTPEEKDAMARLMTIMNGGRPAPVSSRSGSSTPGAQPVELAGPGVITRQEIDAMANVMSRLNNAMTQVSGDMITESSQDPEIREALITQSNAEGVKIGIYQIRQNLDESLMVNKQNFSVINKVTGETIAHELGLYEAAHGLVRLLNSGNFVNSPKVRELLEAESTFTSQRLDAMRYNKRMKQARAQGDDHKHTLFEARKQRAMDSAMQAKALIKSIYSRL